MNKQQEQQQPESPDYQDGEIVDYGSALDIVQNGNNGALGDSAGSGIYAS